MFFIPEFRALLDNYEEDTSKREVVTQKEREENVAFIEAIMETEVMKETHRFLFANNKAPSDEDEFKEWLYDLWFKIYRRTREDRSLLFIFTNIRKYSVYLI